jgi:hypothetical protein
MKDGGDMADFTVLGDPQHPLAPTRIDVMAPSSSGVNIG